MSATKPVDAEVLTGYADLGDQPPRPMALHSLQSLRDAVDPKGSGGDGLRHKCENCGPCVDDGTVVSAQDVQALLQHIDYLQRELDEIETASINYFGDED